MKDEYMKGYMDGFQAGFFKGQSGFDPEQTGSSIFYSADPLSLVGQSKPKRKVKQTKKQKLLTQMTKKKWDKYKKGRGKKTYVEIRAEVSRSQAYKKAAKRL
jgi:hypothetical protein